MSAAAEDGQATPMMANAAAAPVASTSKLTLEREKRRIALRATNADVWRNGATLPNGPLDSNMKKNTAFIKRVRQSLGVETKEQLLKDAATLNLDKYIEEIVQAIPEGLSRCTTAKDCIAAAESLSVLHGRFNTALFALPLTALFNTLLAAPSRTVLQATSAEQREKDETARVQRQRVLLRAVAELALTEIVRQDKGKQKATPTSTSAEANEAGDSPGQDWLYTTLRDLLASDREHANVPILITLLKGLGSSLVGSASDGGAADLTEQVASISLEEQVVAREMQLRFRKLCETYFSTLGKRIVKENSRLQEQDRRNHEAYIRSGEIFEDRQQGYEKMTRSFERLHEWGKQLSDLLGVPLPALTTESKSSGVGLAVNLDSRMGGNNDTDAEYLSGKSVWEDEDTRRFYEDLVDLQEMVPPSLLQAQTGGKVKGEEEATDGKAKQDEAPAQPSAAPQSPPLDKDTPEDAGLPAGPAAQLNAFLAGLPELSNRAMIDTAAVDFAFLNNKIARRRLVKQVSTVPRNRSDLIPYYARLIATLSKYMPDVGQGVIAVLDEEFRYLQRKRNVDMAETRAKNARFLGELVKFRVTPLITIFHCFKVCLDDLNGSNVDIIATFLETCGRYLLRSEETSERMRSTVELLRRKRAAQNLDARQQVLLDNAYYQCNPPEREVVATKARTPVERYITHLIYDVLTRGSQERVVKQLRKLPWDDAVTRDTLQNVFVRSWRIRFSNLHLLAIMLFDLQAYHADFVVYVIDSVCEQIRVGMETNIFKDNQRRVATLKYLGELYNYRLVNSDVVFEQLMSLVSFGHPYGRPLPGQVSSIDAPDDYFRIRLVCTLLDACGMCFDQGSLRKRLDEYLLFLNVYITSKEQPVPMDIDFMLSDTLEALRPEFRLKRTFEEAAQAVDALLAAQEVAAEEKRREAEAMALPTTTQEPTAVATQERDDDDSGSSSESDSSDGGDDDDDDEIEGVKATPRHLSKDDASTDSATSSSSESDGDDATDSDGEEDEDEEELAHARRPQVDQEAEDEFERELAKMMAESNASAQQASGGGSGSGGASNRTQRGLFDVGLPFIKKASAATMSNGTGDGVVPAQHMRFSLLSKRGNRQQTHEVHVPIDAALAVHSRANEQQQLAEREQLKKLVLGIETREQAEERGSLEASLARRGFRVRQPGRET